MRRAQSGNRAKSGRPPHAPQAGVAVPDGPVCTSPPPYITLARLNPHERRIPNCPPSPSPAHRADRADRRAQTEGGPHARGQRRRPPRALTAASPLGVEHDRAPAGGRPGACRGSAAGSS
eukprot:7329127-Prymnesium_polylepis.1